MLVISELSKTFRTPVGEVKALDRVSLEVQPGRSMGIIGESGSGKSTLGRIAVGLLEPSAGSVAVDGQDLGTLTRRQRRDLRTSVSVVFQEPFASLDPRRTALETVLEPLEVKQPGRAHAAERVRAARQALETVGIGAELADRYPGALSGGQQQRVGIARAIVTRPKLVLLDEPTSALDRSIRADILALLSQLRASHGLTYLVITHDVETVEALADDVVVMYRGCLVEAASAAEVLQAPQHAYTQLLLSARLSLDPDSELTAIPDVSDHLSTTNSRTDNND